MNPIKEELLRLVEQEKESFRNYAGIGFACKSEKDMLFAIGILKHYNLEWFHPTNDSNRNYIAIGNIEIRSHFDVKINTIKYVIDMTFDNKIPYHLFEMLNIFIHEKEVFSKILKMMNDVGHLEGEELEDACILWKMTN